MADLLMSANDAGEGRPGGMPNSLASDPQVAAAAQRIAGALQEPLVWLMENVVKTLGLERAEHLLQQTLEIEAQGGMSTCEGDRRRTPGGVYLKLLKEQVGMEEQSRIFIGGPKTKPVVDRTITKNAGDPAPLGPMPWEEARVEIARVIRQLNESLRDTTGPAPVLPVPDFPMQLGDLQRAPLQANAERASVKITLVGRPSQVSKTKSCVVVAMKGSRPPSLPKGLPPAPDNSDFSYAVFISLRHWAKVAPIMAQDKNERLLIEGYPIFDPKRGVTVVLAQSVRTINLSRRESRPGDSRSGRPS